MKLGPGSNRWFARASWELAAGGELRWTIERFSGGGSWNDDNHLELGVYGSGLKYRAIGSTAPVEDWRFGMVRLPKIPQPGTLLYANDRIRTYSGSNGLVFGVDNVTGKRLWQVDSTPDANVQVKTGLGLGEGNIVQIRRQPTGFAGLWRQIDAILGKATEWTLLSGVHLEGVSLDFSSPHANWLVLSSVDAKGWETTYYVVSGAGKVKPWHEKEWLKEPLGVWAKDELVYAENNSLVAVNVWNLRRRIIAALPPVLGRVRRLVRGDAGRIYLEGEYRIAEFDCNAGRCDSEVRLLAPPLDQVKDPSWSPHGRFLLGRVGGLDEYGSIWSLGKNSLVFRQPAFLESTSVAVSPDNESIALSSASESVEIHLESGALRFGAPLPSTLPNVNQAQTSTVHAISADGDFAVTSKEGTGEVSVARSSPTEPRLLPLFRRSAKSLKTVRALFEKSSQTAFVKVDGDWFAVALPTGKAKPVLESLWLEDALEFSSDGSFVLTPTGVTTGRGAESKVVPFVPAPNELANEFIGEAKLAFHGKLALFPTKEGLLVWSTTDGKWLGQLKQVVQGLIFTQDKPGEQGHGLVEVFGDAARESLLCKSGERLYPWAVCSGRFEAPGLLRETLRRSCQSP
jgi:WD40 repeat protein